MERNIYSCEIIANSEEFGGGWRMKLLVDDEDAGTVLFPLDEYTDLNEAYKEAIRLSSNWVTF